MGNPIWRKKSTDSNSEWKLFKSVTTAYTTKYKDKDGKDKGVWPPEDRDKNRKTLGNWLNSEKHGGKGVALNYFDFDWVDPDLC